MKLWNSEVDSLKFFQLIKTYKNSYGKESPWKFSLTWYQDQIFFLFNHVVRTPPLLCLFYLNAISGIRTGCGLFFFIFIPCNSYGMQNSTHLLVGHRSIPIQLFFFLLLLFDTCLQHKSVCPKINIKCVEPDYVTINLILNLSRIF
jgi:hypothetical protein